VTSGTAAATVCWVSADVDARYLWHEALAPSGLQITQPTLSPAPP
jgi:hypothetical protein